MKRKYTFLSCALAAALIAGLAHATSDQDAGKRPAGESGKTVELIFKTPPGGVVFDPDHEIDLARIDTSPYRRIRVVVRPADRRTTGSPAYVWIYESELEFPLYIIPTEGSTIVDLPGELIILKGVFGPDVGDTPVHVVVYGER